MTLVTLARRNVLRNKVRLALAVLGVAVALTAFATLRTAVLSWNAAATLARRDRLVTRQKMTFVMPLPKRYVKDLENAKDAKGAPLIARATFASWFGGRDPSHPKAFFASYMVDAASYFDVYDEVVLSPSDRQAFTSDKSAVVVGEGLASEMGWKRGDRITLESSIYPATDGRQYELVVAGIYATRTRAFDRLVLLRWDRVDDAQPEARRGQIGWITSRAPSPEVATEAARAIDAMFGERETETLTQDERAFNLGFLGMASAVMDVLAILSLVVLAIQALVLANAISMSVRERAREYASLAAVGFPKLAIAGVIVAESTAVAALGGALGGVLAWLFIDRGLSSFFESQLAFLFPVFRLDPSTLVLGVVLAVATGTISGLLPAYSMIRPRVADALRGAV